MDIKMKQMRSADNLKSPNLFRRKDSILKWAIRGYVSKGILILVVVFGLAITAYKFTYGKKPVDPAAAIANETDDLTARIGEFMDLPATEKPTLATVTDKAKLGDQDFFQDAQDGDKLLVYARAKKVILYRPSTGKIIDVTKLSSDDGSS